MNGKIITKPAEAFEYYFVIIALFCQCGWTDNNSYFWLPFWWLINDDEFSICSLSLLATLKAITPIICSNQIIFLMTALVEKRFLFWHFVLQVSWSNRERTRWWHCQLENRFLFFFFLYKENANSAEIADSSPNDTPATNPVYKFCYHFLFLKLKLSSAYLWNNRSPCVTDWYNKTNSLSLSFLTISWFEAS